MKHEDREWYKSKGICPLCRVNKAFPNHVHCEECLEKLVLNNVKYVTKEKAEIYNKRHNEKKKKQRKERAAAGVCTYCGKARAVKGQLCLECWLKRQKYRKKEKIGRFRPGEHFRDRVNRNVCMYCQNPVVTGYCFCEDCLPKRQETGRKVGLKSSTMREQITADWNLARAIHKKKEESS